MRGASGHELVQDRAQEVDVGPGPDPRALAVRQLGRHVGRRPAGGLQGGPVGDRGLFAGLTHVDREAPVHHEDLTELAEHHILGLEVVVDDEAAVGEGDGVADLDQDPEVILEAVGLGPDSVLVALGVEEVLPGDPVHELHRQDDLAGRVRAEVIDGDDVGMVKASRGDSFCHEALPTRLAADPDLALEGHRALEAALVGPIDDAHSAAADDLL